MCRKLVFDPRTGTLVMNSMPGILQFYDPYVDKGIFIVSRYINNICEFIGRRGDSPLYFTRKFRDLCDIGFPSAIKRGIPESDNEFSSNRIAFIVVFPTDKQVVNKVKAGRKACRYK
jgi:hypothetical protein